MKSIPSDCAYTGLTTSDGGDVQRMEAPSPPLTTTTTVTGTGDRLSGGHSTRSCYHRIIISHRVVRNNHEKHFSKAPKGKYFPKPINAFQERFLILTPLTADPQPLWGIPGTPLETPRNPQHLPSAVSAASRSTQSGNLRIMQIHQKSCSFSIFRHPPFERSKDGAPDRDRFHFLRMAGVLPSCRFCVRF